MKQYVYFIAIFLCSFAVTQKSYSDEGDNKAAYQQEAVAQEAAPQARDAFQIDASGHVRMDGKFQNSSDYQDNLRLKATDLKIKAGTDVVKLTTVRHTLYLNIIKLSAFQPH
ncbi:MAG: hypothetical protein HY072_02630 [Deltaproteobacteria bacterium]|nr:hypothetical protein [Deltaproteobacteria bacterium]